MRNLFKDFRCSEKGQALVEFALVLPIFILILFGIIEFSRVWQTVNVLSSAAREGARRAAVTAPDISQSTNAALRILNAANVSNATITVSGPDASNEVSVTVSITYTPITGSIIPGFGAMSLSRSTTMHFEN